MEASTAKELFAISAAYRWAMEDGGSLARPAVTVLKACIHDWLEKNFKFSIDLAISCEEWIFTTAIKQIMVQYSGINSLELDRLNGEDCVRLVAIVGTFLEHYPEVLVPTLTMDSVIVVRSEDEPKDFGEDICAIVLHKVCDEDIFQPLTKNGVPRSIRQMLVFLNKLKQ